MQTLGQECQESGRNRWIHRFHARFFRVFDPERPSIARRERRTPVRRALFPTFVSKFVGMDNQSGGNGHNIRMHRYKNVLSHILVYKMGPCGGVHARVARAGITDNGGMAPVVRTTAGTPFALDRGACGVRQYRFRQCSPDC